MTTSAEHAEHAEKIFLVMVSHGPAEATLHGPAEAGHYFRFLKGALRMASSAFSWFHWARNNWPAAPPERLDVHASVFPSGDGTGSPSKPSEYVTRTGSLVPAASTMKSSKFSKPSLLDE